MITILRYISLLILSSSTLLCYAQKKSDNDNLQDYWIDKYLSVSFPLRNIKVNSSSADVETLLQVRQKTTVALT